MASKVNTKRGAVQETYLDNKQFMEMLKISPRTAQTWRDEGKISFSQVGNKIYYKLSDIERTMQEYYNKSFAKK
ncbi:helix-turn-helix domain-containing protein [Chryseobacterium sp. TY4]